MKSILSCMTSFFLIGNAVASDVVETRVNKILTYNTHTLVFVDTELAPGNKPACATNKYDYIFDINTDQGRAIYSALLAAQKTSSKVMLAGLGSCHSDQENAEELKYVISL